MLTVGWILVVIACLIVWALMRSPWGRVIKAIREDEDAVRSLGKNVYSYKMQSLIIGGLLGALGGFIFALAQAAVQPDLYSPDLTFFAYTILILGGAARVLGPVVGAMIFWCLLQLTAGALEGAVRTRRHPDLADGHQPGRSGPVHAGRSRAAPAAGVPAAGNLRRPEGDRPRCPHDELPDDTPLTRQEAGEVRSSPSSRRRRPQGGGAARVRRRAARAGVAKPDPILVADNVVRRFGGLTAVDVGHVEIQRGSITALIGPNGAGKTTFFNLLTGFDRPDDGSWTFNGQSLAGMPAYKVARGGMVRTFQLTKALSKLTVIENMRLGAIGQRGESVWRAMFPGSGAARRTRSPTRAEELLGRFKLDTKRDDFAGSLSGGQRKLLEMARALMVEPEMVMLDEPMAGVNPALTQSLLGHVKDLREQGMTVLFVEHDMDMVRDISDWVLVMAQGKLIAEGPPDARHGATPG